MARVLQNDIGVLHYGIPFATSRFMRYFHFEKGKYVEYVRLYYNTVIVIISERVIIIVILLKMTITL